MLNKWRVVPNHLQGVSFVKHLLDHSASSLSSLKAPLNLQVSAMANKTTAVDMKVDLLSLRVEKLEAHAEKSQAVFEEEQDGRINVEWVIFAFSKELFIKHQLRGFVERKS